MEKAFIAGGRGGKISPKSLKRPIAELASTLMELELKGVVRSLAGKRFEIV